MRTLILAALLALTPGCGMYYLQRDPNGGLLALVTGTGTTGEYYYVLDGQSSIIGLVDAAGTERARYTYDPYGAHDTAVALNGTLPDNPAIGAAFMLDTDSNGEYDKLYFVLAIRRSFGLVRGLCLSGADHPFLLSRSYF